MCIKFTIFKSIFNIQTNNLSSSFFVFSRSRFQRILFIDRRTIVNNSPDLKEDAHMTEKASINSSKAIRYIVLLLVLLRPLMDQRTIVKWMSTRSVSFPFQFDRYPPFEGHFEKNLGWCLYHRSMKWH